MFPASELRPKPLSDRFLDWPGHSYLMLIVSYLAVLVFGLWQNPTEFPLWAALVGSALGMFLVWPFVLVFYCISAFLIGLAFVVYEAMRAPLPD